MAAAKAAAQGFAVRVTTTGGSGAHNHSWPSTKGEQRLDVLEFIAVARVIGRDPVEIFSALLREQ